MSFSLKASPLRPGAALGLLGSLVLSLGELPARRASEAAAAAEPIFSALRVDGRTSSGRLVRLSTDRITLASEDATEEELPLRVLVKLTQDQPTPPQILEGSHLLLPDGDRLMRVIVGSTTETAIEAQCHSALGKLTVPLDCVLGLILTAPTEPDAFDQLWDRVRSEPRTTEVVWMANGDRMTGGFLGMDDRAVKLQVEGKAVEIDRTGVVALGFDSAILKYPRPQSDFADVTLADGSRLGVTGARIEKGQVTATTRFGQTIRFPLGDLVRLEARTDAVVYLSDRKVDAQNYVSFVGPTRSFRSDQTVDGHQFRLGGRAYERGLGTQSRTLLAYKLRPGDKRFQALVGVDDRAGPLGSVVFRVLTDGVERVSTASLTCKDTPQVLDVDVSRSKLLILITEFGDRGDVRDLADWVEARIIR
jgi:hypothetical protein